MPTGVNPDHEPVTALREREPTAAEALISTYERFGRGAAMKYDAWVAKAAKQPIVLLAKTTTLRNQKRPTSLSKA
jgi:hypothetical protein